MDWELMGDISMSEKLIWTKRGIKANKRINSHVIVKRVTFSDLLEVGE